MPLLETQQLSKHYGGVEALVSANFKIDRGEHIAIVGDNGAGKSTFVRNITGVEQPDSGKIFFEGGEIHMDNPLDSRNYGIETVYQNLALADELSVVENIFLGRELFRLRLGVFSTLSHKRMQEQAKELLSQTGIKIPNLKESLKSLSGGQRQCIAIARAVGWGSKLIIMDEPTAALGVQETEHVEGIIRQLKERKISVLIVSHNLRQVFSLVDSIYVFRQGKIVGSHISRKETHPNEIVSLITGVETEAA